MKTCILSFSGRAGGNCARIAELLRRQLGGEVYDFSALSVTPCGGCRYECFQDRALCPYFGDPVFGIYDAVTHSDLACFVLPNYCDYPNALFFAFNERSQCYFQRRQDLLERYLAVRKKFVVISNTGRENFTAALRYHVPEGTEPEILFLSARAFQKVSIRGDLTDSPEAREALRRFAEEGAPVL